MNQNIFLVDFDGTINLSDLAYDIVSKFGSEKWRYYEQLFEENKLSLEDTISTQYSLITASKKEILEETDRVFKIRKNFVDFARYCHEQEIQLKIVSGGIDFVIRHVLDNLDLPKTPEIFSVKTEFQSERSLKVTKPVRHFSDSIDFKHDVVRHFKKQNFVVSFVGDGSSDYGAVLEADKIFSVYDSKLSAFCKNKGLNFSEFTDFKEIIEFFNQG